MAGIGKRTNGKWFVRFVDPEGKRRTMALGTKSERQATRFKLKIEELLTARRTSNPMDEEVAAWVDKLKAPMRDQLVKFGLLDADVDEQDAEKPNELELEVFLARYFEKRKDVKSSTLEHWGHTRRNLIQFFGGEKHIDEITAGNARDFELFLKTVARENRYGDIDESEGLSLDTVRKRIGNAKQFFADAVEHELIPSNPFKKLKSAVKGNRKRDFFITREMADLVLDACPDAQWRLIFALARFGGLRCTSEFVRLRLDDVDWGRRRIRVTSPKTEHHEGKEYRFIPLFPELRPYLEAVWHQAEEGEEYFITRFRDPNQNPRTTMLKIISRAGLKPWPKLFQNLRASRQTELEETFPSHVACAWMGNSQSVAEKHYLQVTEDHFDRANDAALHQRSSKDSQGAVNEKSDTTQTAENREESQGVAIEMGDTGLEPVASAL